MCVYRLAPQDGHFVAPAGTLAPQLRQVIPPMDPVELMVEAGIDPIPDGGIAGAIVGPFPKKAFTCGLVR